MTYFRKSGTKLHFFSGSCFPIKNTFKVSADECTKKLFLKFLNFLILIVILLIALNLVVARIQKAAPVAVSKVKDVMTSDHNQSRDVKLEELASIATTENSTSTAVIPASNLPTTYNFKWDIIKDNKVINSYKFI